VQDKSGLQQQQPSTMVWVSCRFNCRLMSDQPGELFQTATCTVE
jgi:hypothetical protein